jgi:hypothetical protein
VKGWFNRAPILFLFVLILSPGVGAQTINTDEGSLFGSSIAEDSSGKGDSQETLDLFAGDLLVDVPENASDLAVSSMVAVEIGGSYQFSLTGEVAWDSVDDLADTPFEPDSQGISVDLGATVLLDARPTEDFRVFGSIDLNYPFTTNETASSSRDFEDIVGVTELFSDFMIGDILFLRGGKHTISWGVGYFFSPADVLNLTSINPEDPEAEREGPVSLRVNLPVDFHNLYLYLIANPLDDGVQLAVAPKAEMVLGGTEVGIGALYHPGRVPRAMLTVSTSLMDFDLFGELEASIGSDRRFVEADDLNGLTTSRYTDKIFAALTGGLRYTYAPEQANWAATLAGQYMWNGEGYEDIEVLRKNQTGVIALLQSSELSLSDLVFPGRHYAAASLNVSLGRNATWSIGTFWLSNLSDGSAQFSPSVTVRLADQLNLRAAATFTYGPDGAEMTPFGSQVGASIAANFGSGQF